MSTAELGGHLLGVRLVDDAGSSPAITCWALRASLASRFAAKSVRQRCQLAEVSPPWASLDHHADVLGAAVLADLHHQRVDP